MLDRERPNASHIPESDTTGEALRVWSGAGFRTRIWSALASHAHLPPACYNARMESAKDLALEVHRRLLEEYGEPERRDELSPLDELISTILSQNTNDENRDRAFNQLRERFPDWEAVQEADTEQVIEAIRSAGLANQKGPRIQNALEGIARERGELDLDFLKTLAPVEAKNWLMRFKGVGPKTAAIVLLFSLNMPAFPVDTHIHRVTGRLGLRPEKMNAEKTHTLMERLLPPEAYYAAHLNLIRHGREICHARKPECERCVLLDICDYGASYLREKAQAESAGPTF